MSDPVGGSRTPRQRDGGAERTVRVLIVEDHAMVARGIELGLSQQGDIHAVGRAASLGEAVESAALLRPDVILLDNVLPDGNGVDAVGALRERAPDASVLLVSGAVDEELAAAAVRAGCMGAVSKSADLPELADAVRRASRGEMAIAQSLMQGVVALLAGGEETGGLTPREREVLELLADGLGPGQIAVQLELSRNTVRNHVRAILQKLDAHTQLEAVAIARRRGVVRR